uniref:Gasdermin-A3-like n=1 Tax=Cyanistes caeruleus TaxID=156563 RepID=A0A8C0VPQ3_CYACU
MFKKLTKFLVSKMDPCKELVPVESIADNEHFRPLCLLIERRKSNRIFHSAPYYQRTGFTLEDVLLPGEDESLHQDSSQFTLRKTSADQADGGLSIAFDPASVGLQGGASLSKEFSITPQKKRVPLESLEALRRGSSKSHKQQSSTTENRHQTMEDKQSIVIPKGCTLAFRTIRLHIRDGAWDLDYFPAEPVRRAAYVADGMYFTDFTSVVAEVNYSCRIFPELSSDLLVIVLNTIKAGMRDKNLLQELRQKMEEVPEQNYGYELKTESPHLKDLFRTLQHSPRDRLLPLAEGITYVLDALYELMDDQLLLLLESLERKIVSQQLRLVRTQITFRSFQGGTDYFNSNNISIVISQEEQRLTMELVELSGVQLQEDGSALLRDQPFEPMAALFVALYALNLLSGSE